MMLYRPIVAVALGFAFTLAGCSEESGTEPAGTSSLPSGTDSAPQDLASGGPAPSETPSMPSPTGDEQAAVEEAVDEAAAAADAATEAARNVMQSYITVLEQAADKLAGVTDRISATAAAPEMQSLISQLTELRDQIGSLPDESLSALRAEFDAQLARVEDMAREQIERISTDSDLSGLLGDLLDQIPLLTDG